MGGLADPYPDPPSVGEYLTDHDAYRERFEEVDVGASTLYRALWQPDPER